MQHLKLSVVKTFALLLTANLLLAQETVPEVLPQVMEQELKSRGMTAQEAVMKAAQLGIDLSNPQQAAARARQLGLPESQIQMLQQQAQGVKATGPEEQPAEQVEAADHIFLARGFLEGTHRARAEVSRQPEEDAPREVRAHIENISPSQVNTVQYRRIFSAMLASLVDSLISFLPTSPDNNKLLISSLPHCCVVQTVTLESSKLLQ